MGKVRRYVLHEAGENREIKSRISDSQVIEIGERKVCYYLYTPLNEHGVPIGSRVIVPGIMVSEPYATEDKKIVVDVNPIRLPEFQEEVRERLSNLGQPLSFWH